jgi:sortase A
MKYSYKKGVEKKISRKWLTLCFTGLIVGIYILGNVYSPEALHVLTPSDTTAKKLVAVQPKLKENRIYVPKINLDVAIVPINGHEKSALEKGAIHRTPTSGDPQSGGNYVVAAHRFNLGLTPTQTRAKSPFYHIDKVNVGDDIYVDYEGQRYAYKVEERKSVSPTAIEIEAPTDDNRLTLYSCELAGSRAGREVVIASPVGKIIWTSDGIPKIQTL